MDMRGLPSQSNGRRTQVDHARAGQNCNGSQHPHAVARSSTTWSSSMVLDLESNRCRAEWRDLIFRAKYFHTARSGGPAILTTAATHAMAKFGLPAEPSLMAGPLRFRAFYTKIAGFKGAGPAPQVRLNCDRPP
jgi:hypothetical protein